jgi:DDE superfamily endonuclease/Winged helix-turn helix
VVSRYSPFVIVLSDEDRVCLEQQARAYASPYGAVVRAKIVLMAADGVANCVIAERLGLHVSVVSRWRKRFAGEGMGGLADRPRSGRPRDPAFADKAGRLLDLYQRRWHGVGLGADEDVISADEKSQLQVLRRIHPDQPAQPGRVHRVEFEYERGGTVADLAAYDVHRAQLMGRVEPTTGITPFAALVEQVMTTEPYASARRVFWVVDNGSSHAGTASIQRMAAAWPTATLVHLPVHASWLNQIEIVFSMLQRKVIAPADFTDREALIRRITEFQPRFNATATPFDWRFTRADLQRLLAGIDDQHNGVVLPAAA